MKYTIGIIGGTGKEGSGLAYRWALAGHKVIIGSRQEEKALAAVDTLFEKIGEQEVELSGTSNAEAVKACDIAVLTVPFSAHASTLEGLKEELQGKLLIDVCVPWCRRR
jgi:NADPH-dependent F420 reductase